MASKPRKHFRAAALTAVAVAVLGTALLTGGTAFGLQGLTDPGGDANGGPDIRDVKISDAGGILTFKFTVTGMKVVPESGVKATNFWVGLDTDKNGKSNYFLNVFSTSSGVSWDIEDSNDKMVKQTPTMSFFSSGNSYLFKLSSSDIGGATDFNVYVSSASHDESKWIDADDAPDGGVWSYSLTSVKPVIGTPNTSRTTPVPGKAFVITFPVTRSDTGARLTSGEMTSDVTAGGAALNAVVQFKNGTAMLRFTVPATATGKPLAVRVAINFAGRSVTKSTSFRVS